KRCPAESVAIARRSTPVRVTSELLQAPVHVAATLDQLGFQPVELTLAHTHQLQLGSDVGERLLQDPSPRLRILGLVPFPPELSSCCLRLQQLLQLVERETKQLLEPDDLTYPLDIRVGVAAVLALRAFGRAG